MKFPDRAPSLKIRKINKKSLVTQVSKTHTGTMRYMIYVLPFVLIVTMSTIAKILLYKRLKKIFNRNQTHFCGVNL